MNKIGDIVQLKSGGPNMTVVKVEGGWVNCMWFAGEHFDKVTSFSFPPDTLQLVDKPHKKGTVSVNY
jgi:uncharacterized protein YodC (DUF2158 family)